MKLTPSLKFHLHYNLLLSICASTAISAVILLKYGQFSWWQLSLDSFQAILVSFVVGVSVPFHIVTQPLKSKQTLSDWQLRLLTNAFIGAVVSAAVTAYFKLMLFGFGAEARQYFIADYPLSWLVGLGVAFVVEPYLVTYLKGQSQ